MYCPQCGASQLGFANRVRALVRGPMRGDAPGAPPPQDGASPDRAGSDSDAGPAAARPRRLGWRPVFACSALAVVAYAAYQVGRGDAPTPDAPTQQASAAPDAPAAVAGAVANGTPTDPNALAGTNGTSSDPNAIPADVPPGTRSAAPPMQNIDIAGLNIASGAFAPVTAPSFPASDIQTPAPAAAPNASAKVPAHVGIDIAIAREALSRHRLWPARRALENALRAQPGNADALQLQTDLSSREHERDDLIDHARNCARSGEWACERNYAEQAANVDTSSLEAKRLLAGGSGHRRRYVSQRYSDPDLLGRLRSWIHQSVAQSDVRASSPQTPEWYRP